MGVSITTFSEILAKHPVIFLGAGMSAPLGYPTAAELARSLSPHLSEAGTEAEDLDQIIEHLKEKLGREETIRIIQGHFARREVDSAHNPYFLLKLILNNIGGEFILVTTNWDLESDQVFGEDSVVKSPADYGRVRESKTIVVKLHGDFSRPIILSQKEAKEHLEDREKLYLHVFGSAVARPVVMLGYSARDPDFLEWAKKVKDKGSVEFALFLHENDKNFSAKETATGKDITEFLRDEAANMGIEVAETITPLSAYEQMVEVAKAASAKGKSIVCFAPRKSGKTIAFENTRPKFVQLFTECHDIGSSGYGNDKLLETIDKLPIGRGVSIFTIFGGVKLSRIGGEY